MIFGRPRASVCKSQSPILHSRWLRDEDSLATAFSTSQTSNACFRALPAAAALTAFPVSRRPLQPASRIEGWLLERVSTRCYVVWNTSPDRLHEHCRTVSRVLIAARNCPKVADDLRGVLTLGCREGCVLRSRSSQGVTGVVKESVVGRVLLMSCAHRLLSLAFMESLTIYGLVIALVPAPAVLKTPSSDCHRMIRTRARCLPRCSSSPTLSSSEQDVSGEVLQLRVGGASEEEEESVRSEKCLANRKGFVLKGS